MYNITVCKGVITIPEFDMSQISNGISSGNSPFDQIMNSANRNNQWSAEQAQIQRDWQEGLFNKTMDFNSAQAALNRSWQKEMSDTAHQREVQDLIKAGLNPVLSATGGNGAAVGSGAQASIGSVPSGAKGDTDESSTGAIASYLAQLLAAETSIRNTETSAQAALAQSELMSEANKYAALQSAGAMSYSAQLSLLNSREQREWNTLYPSTPSQAAAAIVNAAGGLGQLNQSISSAAQRANQLGQSVRQAWQQDGIKGALTALGEGVMSLIRRKS